MKQNAIMDLIVRGLVEKNIHPKSWNFYLGRILAFLETDYVVDRPLDAVTHYEINKYLEINKKADSEKYNCYNALKTFFDFTYNQNRTKDIMQNVIKLHYISNEPKYISDEEYEELKEYCLNDKMRIEDRLLLGLFIFTGLKRDILCNITHNDIIRFPKEYSLMIYKKGYVLVPTSKSMVSVLSAYLENHKNIVSGKKLITYDTNYVSVFIAKLTHSIIGKKVTPTVLSNTFIRKILAEHDNIFIISQLVQIGVQTLRKHYYMDSLIYEKQKKYF